MRLSAAFIAFLFLQSCSILQNTPFLGTDELNRNVAENAEILSQAHADATNAIILRNILRARDRWPTNYVTLSGISAQPQVNFKASGAFGPLGIGNPDGPFMESTAGVEQTATSAANYTVNPFTSDNNGNSLLTPIGHNVFADYWAANWPRDVLFLVLVDSIEINGHRYINDPDNPEAFILQVAQFLSSEDCAYFLRLNGVAVANHCAYSNLVYAYNERNDVDKCDLFESFDRLKFLKDRDVGDMGLLGQIEKLASLDDRKVKLVKSNSGIVHVSLCKPATDDDKYFLSAAARVDATPSAHHIFDGNNNLPPAGAPKARLRLRSIDSAVYYVGEWLRRHGDYGHDNVLPGRVTSPGECGSFPDASRLFSVYPRDFLKTPFRANKDIYAAVVRHGGKIHYAARRLEFQDAETGDCPVDRSGTVLALLSQLYLRAQESDFLKAPNANILRTQ